MQRERRWTRYQTGGVDRVATSDGAEDTSSANILRFPHRPTLSSTAAVRLEDAIRALDAANAELRANISAWRSATDALVVSLGETEGSLQVLETNLACVSSRLSGTAEQGPEGDG